MEYNIKIDEPSPDFWEKMSELGVKRFTHADGLIYQYVSFDTAVKILKSNCLNYSVPNKFNDPFDLTSSLLDTSITKEQLINLVSSGFITSDEEKQKIIDFNLSNPDLIPNLFTKTLEDTKSEIGISCFSKSPLKTLMWSHYADKHSGICFGFAFEKAGGNGIMQLSVRYADKVEPRSYFTETIFSIYNWIFTKSKVWEYEEEVRRVYINKNGLIQFDKKELIEIYYGVRVTEDQIKFIKDLIVSNHYLNIRKQSCMKISPDTFDLTETKLPWKQNGL